MLKRGETSAENICLLLFLLFRCIGEAAPTVHALFAGCCGTGMRIGHRTSMESKDVTFPLDIVFGLTLLCRRFLFLLACFEALVGEVQLDGSTIKRFVQVGHVVMTAIDAPSSPQFLFNQ